MNEKINYCGIDVSNETLDLYFINNTSPSVSQNQLKLKLGSCPTGFISSKFLSLKFITVFLL